MFLFHFKLNKGKEKLLVLQLQHRHYPGQRQREILQHREIGGGAMKEHSFTYTLRILLHLLHHFSRPQDLQCR